jgi:hypothetical protein
MDELDRATRSRPRGAIQHHELVERAREPGLAEPVTNADFTRALGRVLSRPAIIPLRVCVAGGVRSDG